MKKLILVLSFWFLFMSNNVVFAQNNNIVINANGVIVTEKEYQFILDFYGENYFENMVTSDYEWIQDLNLNNSEVEVVTIYDTNSLLRGVSHTTASKKLTIAKSCSTNCSIIVRCQWLTNPVIRSYDVIGARLVNTELVTNTIITKLSSSSGTEYFSDLKLLSDGFGVSVKLPSNSTNISVEQKFTVYSGGSVFASYQHAKSNISLSTSKLYTISSNGYGRVFDFYGSATNVFDQMGGVDISL